jgi:hypothetical protein
MQDRGLRLAVFLQNFAFGAAPSVVISCKFTTAARDAWSGSGWLPGGGDQDGAALAQNQGLAPGVGFPELKAGDPVIVGELTTCRSVRGAAAAT